MSRDGQFFSPRLVRTHANWLVALAIFTICGCQTVPVTGRKRVLLVAEPNEIELGATAFRETLVAERASENEHFVELVERVGQRLAVVAERPDYDWEFRVLASPEQNAFCLPGGKVAVYEGILPICQNEGGLAVVMSHEVAHALARHGAERMTNDYMVNGVGTALQHFTRNQQVAVHDRLMSGYGIASKYGFVLPYSRKHESEADQIGLLLMARAGYDPSEAPRFWHRFAQAKSGEYTPEFLSTHPNDERRAAELQAQLAVANEVYAQAPARYGIGTVISFNAGGGALRAAEGTIDGPSAASSNAGSIQPAAFDQPLRGLPSDGDELSAAVAGVPISPLRPMGETAAATKSLTDGGNPLR